MILSKAKEVAGRTVVVRWELPLEGACPVVGYNVYYREVQTRKGTWISLAVNRNATNYTLTLPDCWKKYGIAVTSQYALREDSLGYSQVWNVITRGGD